MEGRQSEIYDEVQDIANKVREGLYGWADDIDEDSIKDDLELITLSLIHI